MSDINDSTYTQIDDEVLERISKGTLKIFLQSQSHLEMKHLKERGDILWELLDTLWSELDLLFSMAECKGNAEAHIQGHLNTNVIRNVSKALEALEPTHTI